MEVTPSGISTLVKLLQSSKRLPSMHFKFFESLIELNFSHPQKAALSIDTTLSGISMLVNFSQSLNAEAPMLVKPSGSVMLSKSAHSANAELPIFFNVLGREI